MAQHHPTTKPATARSRQASAIHIGVVLLTIGVLAGLAPAPVALANGPGWGNSQPQEPSTDYDVADGWMWTSSSMAQNPDHPLVEPTYFDATLVQVGAGDLSLFSIDGTHTTGPAGAYYAVVAYFGVWHDCNWDGYIGSSLKHTLVYEDDAVSRNQFQQIDDVLCAPGGAHRDGSTVNEFLWLRPSDAYAGARLPSERIEGVRAWADLFGLGTDSPSNGYVGAPAAKTVPDFTLHYVRADASTQPTLYEELKNLQRAESLDPAHAGAPLCTASLCQAWISNEARPVAMARTPDELGLPAVGNQWFTAYGYDDIHADGALARPYTSNYGVEWCAGFTSGIHGGWDCSSGHWGAQAPRVYDPYNLRDVDDMRLAR